MKLSAIIPTYYRRDDLNRTLESLSKQKVSIDETIIIVGPNDKESVLLAQKWETKFPLLTILLATKPSLVQSLNLGLEKVKGDIICLLDDDVWLPEDWSEKIQKTYLADQTIGAYGGRDHIQVSNRPDLSNPAAAKVVGTFRWNGLLIGNHHCGIRKITAEVDVLKGVNLSFRRSAFLPMRIEAALEGQGAEICTEVDICQSIIKEGFKVVYDNNNYVLHYAAQRPDSDNRSDIFSPAWPSRLFNQSVVTAKFRPLTEVFLFSLRSIIIGTRIQPGFVLAVFLIYKHGWRTLKLPWRNTNFIYRGIVHGLRLR